MAKKAMNTSTTVAWSAEMQQNFPIVYAAFERAFAQWGYATAGHLFGQLSKVANELTIFILECGGTPPANFKNVEEVKSALAAAFEKGEVFQKWKVEMKERYPSAFRSLVTMCTRNGYKTIELALASVAQIATLLIVWLGNCNVTVIEESVMDAGDLRKAIERALAYSEKLSADLAL